LGRKKKHKQRNAQTHVAAQAVSPVEVPAEPVAADAPASASASIRVEHADPAPAPTEAPAAQVHAQSEAIEDLDAAEVVHDLDDDSPIEDLDADLDDGGSADYGSLVALVAGLPDDAPRPAPTPSRRDRAPTPPPDEDLVEVVDLDDDDDDAIDRLIANTVVGAPPEVVEDEPEIPVIDLDEEDAPAAPPTARPTGPGPSASPEAARLAAVLARTGFDETDEPAISLDLGEVSTPEARARLLAAALAHAEHKEARYRVPIEAGTGVAWKGLAAAVIVVVAAWVAVAPPAWVRPEPPAQLDAVARTRSIRSALLLQAQQVEAFRVRTQRLPASLTELPAALPNVGYTRSGNRAYQLVAYERDGTAVVYDSANPAAGFRVLMNGLLPPESAP
jgi:hypothetical protein